MPVCLLTESYEAFARARSVRELRVEIERFASYAGFDKFAYSLSMTLPVHDQQLMDQQLILSGYPQGWVDRYVERGYARVDPLLQHAVRSTLPAVWDEQRFHQGETNEFWEEAHSFGLSSGLSFSVHEQPGITGVFSLSRDKVIDIQGRDLATLMGRAQLFASLLQHAVSRIEISKLITCRSLILQPLEHRAPSVG